MNSAAIRLSLVNAARLFGRRRLEIVLPSILTMPARATAGARKKNRKPQNKSLLKKKAVHFRKKSAPPGLSQIFSRDHRRHDVFCTNLCACRCLRASDRGPDRGHGPND